MIYMFSIISLIPNAMIIGWSFYPKQSIEYNYNEINLYLFFIQIQLRWH